MGKRRSHPLSGDRKFHAPKAKRILQEVSEAAGSATLVSSQSNDPDRNPAGMDPQASSKNTGGKADPEGIHVGEHGTRSLQEGRNEGIGGSSAPGSPKQRILEANGTGEDELESPKPGTLDGTGENCPESAKPGILEVDGAGEEPSESVKQVIFDRMGQNHLESSQMGISGAGEEQLETSKHGILDGAGEEQPESLKQGISDGMGEKNLESSQLGILERDGAGEEQPELLKQGISDGMGEKNLESSQMGILEGDGAGEEQPESPQLRNPEADRAEEQLESLKLGILDGTGVGQLESPKLGISEVDGATQEQLQTQTHRVLDRAGEEHPEAVKPGISEADGAREEQLEPLKQGIWEGIEKNQLDSPKEGNFGAHRSSPKDMDPAESSGVLDVAGEGDEGALEDGCVTLSMDMGSLDCRREPQSGDGDTESRNSGSGNAEGGNSSTVTPGLDPAATSTEPQDHWEGTSPELPTEQPFLDAARQQPGEITGQIHTASMRNSPAQTRESSSRATELADASDVICGLIRELSDLNRLAMGARRGLELLRRPKARRGRRPVSNGSRWKEG